MSTEIIQGEKQDFAFNLKSKSTGNRFDLTGFSEIKVCFKSGTTLVEKLESLAEVTVVSAADGQITTSLSVADTDSFAKSDDGDVEIHVDFGGGDVKKSQILGAFFVTEKLC